MEPNKTALFLFKKKTVNKKECVASISVTSNICGIFFLIHHMLTTISISNVS